MKGLRKGLWKTYNTEKLRQNTVWDKNYRHNTTVKLTTQKNTDTDTQADKLLTIVKHGSKLFFNCTVTMLFQPYGCTTLNHILSYRTFTFVIVSNGFRLTANNSPNHGPLKQTCIWLYAIYAYILATW